MIELIRNCSHGSELATYITGDADSKKWVLKVSSTESGIKNLQNEMAGWNWYQERRGVVNPELLCKAVLRKNNYLKIALPYIDGQKGNYRDGLVKNAGLVDAVVSHYIDLWPYQQNGEAPLHGDLSVDNIICDSEGVHIIDWEHFAVVGAPWGFDALYFLFETLWFKMKTRPNNKEAVILERNIRNLNRRGWLLPEMIKTPIQFIKEFILSNSEKWGAQLREYPNKFPVLLYSDEQMEAVNGLLSKRSNDSIKFP